VEEEEEKEKEEEEKHGENGDDDERGWKMLMRQMLSPDRVCCYCYEREGMLQRRRTPHQIIRLGFGPVVVEALVELAEL